MKSKITQIISFREVAGGTCDHCGTGIKYAVRVLLEDGSQMTVGRTCAQREFLFSNACDKRMLNLTPKKALEKQIKGLKQGIADMEKSLADKDHPDYARYSEAWRGYLKQWTAELKLKEVSSC